MENIEKIVEFSANSMTTILGVIAIWTLAVHRDKISAFVRILAQTFINERIKRIKGALGALERLDFDEKEHQKEIFALFGGVAGMIQNLSRKHSGYKECYNEIIQFTEGGGSLTEPKKKRLEQQIHALLDDHALDAALTLTEIKNGPQNNISDSENSK